MFAGGTVSKPADGRLSVEPHRTGVGLRDATTKHHAILGTEVAPPPLRQKKSHRNCPTRTGFYLLSNTLPEDSAAAQITISPKPKCSP